jgi:hypothetical protein
MTPALTGLMTSRVSGINDVPPRRDKMTPALAGLMTSRISEINSHRANGDNDNIATKGCVLGKGIVVASLQRSTYIPTYIWRMSWVK